MVLKEEKLTLPYLSYMRNMISWLCKSIVDDIIFGITNQSLCMNFSMLMQGEFEMSMMGELKYFLRLQIKQQRDRILIHQEKYAKDQLKKFDMDKAKSIVLPCTLLKSRRWWR